MRPEAWREGNRVQLLENGEEYFPRVFAQIAKARHEVLVETFIVFDDVVGRQLQAALIAAARRGARVEVTVDGYGTADLAPKFLKAMSAAGVRVHVFDPRPRWLGFRTNIFRRMHRKIVVVDRRIAYVGGLNFSHDHVRDYGPQAKQDYAIEVEGPVVADLHALAESMLQPPHHWWQRRPALARVAPPARAGGAMALVAARDNDSRRDEIERHYRDAIRNARREVIIANAYFFPGYRLLKELRNAARRGVTVRLILQGRPDMPIVRWVGLTLYDYLLQAGVRIYEYCERPLHGKVAVIDDHWATVGSCNLDPLSLSLNLEANVIVRDRTFNLELRGRLMALIERHCENVGAEMAPRRTVGRQILSFLAFHVARRFPAWAGWLPGHGRPQKPVTLEPKAPAALPAKKEAA